MPDADRLAQHGQASIDQPPVFEAGSTVHIRFRFTVGETMLPTGAGLRVAWRWPFDWSGLQTGDPTAPNHLSVTAPGHCDVTAAFERAAGLNPWQHHIDCQVMEGTLRPGDVVEVEVRSWEGPTFTTEEGYFLMLIRPVDDECWIRLVDAPRFSISAGPPSRLIAIAPGDGVVGDQTTVRVRAVDVWENPSPIDPPRLSGGAEQVGPPVLCEGYPVWEVPMRWTAAGVQRLEVLAGALQTMTNPTRVFETPPERRLFWGDLHAGQSEIGCGAGSLDHHYAYARLVAGLQFTSQQANDHYISAALWQHVRDVTKRHNSEDFLAYLGCEWSPYTEDGGDRNVLYLTDQERLHRSDRFFEEATPDPTADLRRAPEFLDAFRTRDVLLNLHVGGRPTNLDFHAPQIEPLFEVHSTHATSEWFLLDAISRGYKVGVTAGTDGVMGRPGACGPGRRVTRNVRNGLTAVCAVSLTQRHVADAFFARRCYGTSGARILLDVDVNGEPMGGEVQMTAGTVRISVQVEGTAPIERVDFFRGVELISSQKMSDDDSDRLRLLWGGARERGTAGGQRQPWVGTLHLDEGQVTDVVPVAMQCPNDRLVVGDGVLRWWATTAGNDMGCTFGVKGPAQSIRIETEHASFYAALAEVRSESIVVDAGGLNRRIELSRAPAIGSALNAKASFEDSQPLMGEIAYWVRVTQTDRERVWSSPVYVTQGPAQARATVTCDS